MGFVFGLIVLFLDIWAISNVLQSTTSTGRKAIWTLGIFIFPLVGFLVWFLAGPRGSGKAIA